jgi:hypothetical protein
MSYLNQNLELLVAKHLMEDKLSILQMLVQIQQIKNITIITLDKEKQPIGNHVKESRSHISCSNLQWN